MAMARVKQEVSRGPSRAALAEQIERRSAARQARDDALKALNEVEGRRLAADQAFWEAQRIQAEARPVSQDDVVAALLRGETIDPDAPVKEAHANVEAAEQERSRLKVAHESIRAALDRASERLRWADESVREARAAVLQEALPGLIDRFRPRQHELIGLARVLNALRAEHTGPNIGAAERALLDEADSLGRSAMFERCHYLPETAEQLAWEDAMRRLLHDPDCPLPETGE
ncbi:hypothetical protein [Methylobacterium nonmethylotrophicum]|uniref:Uncharacterized protein n=1 Tax=Methylobacterium nonmethylotrophicum TaxID=1141884 RepID=A0A4Z0NIU8_9HYPH|nr:hypothetical protein [Methylobacterium nonmethylotrophicum]TGD96205.1 hypothetical protein EU555_24955 [Methylobacterium nonmethylotrophicum]